jgi:hypothetical protein
MILHSATVTWTLFSLASNISAQTKLRIEVLKVEEEKPTMEELAALPYLDAVVRESLRLHAPVGFTERIASKTDYIPLHTPYHDFSGIARNTVRYGHALFLRSTNENQHLPASAKATRFIFQSVPSTGLKTSGALMRKSSGKVCRICSDLINQDNSRPERWLQNDVPKAVNAIPAVWGNTMSFLAGPHACIGYRVALIQ